MRAGSGSDVLVLGTNECGGHLCAQLWRAEDGGRRLTQLAAPFSMKEAGPGLTLLRWRLAFADVDDGYAVAPRSTGAPAAYTTDGGLSWHSFSAGPGTSLSAVVATAQGTYGLLESRCSENAPVCRYRLGRSAPGSPEWSSVAVPGTFEGDIDLSAQGDEVWLSYGQVEPGEPYALESRDGVAPFTRLAEPDLVGENACALYPMTAEVLWAECGTGMTVSWSRSADGGHHFTTVWDTPGTLGSVFDPLGPTVAYRYTGNVVREPVDALQVTTDGGSRFTTVARLPFHYVTQLLFTDRQHGYVLGAEGTGDRTVVLRTADGGRHWQTVIGA
jgi:hypothetical protein